MKTRRPLLVLALVLGGLGAGAGVAYAGGIVGTASGACADGQPAGVPQQDVLTGPVYLAREGGTNTGGKDVYLTVCYSNTPKGQPSSVVGGFVHADADVNQAGNATTVVANTLCAADANTVGVTCPTTTSATLTTPGNGATVSASAPGGVTLNQTGATVGTPSAAPEPPADGDDKTGASVFLDGQTCRYVNSSTPTCTDDLQIASATVNESDAPHRESDPPSGCIGVGDFCPTGWPDESVTVGRDNEATVTGAVAGVPFSPNVPYTCVRLGNDCPPTQP